MSRYRNLHRALAALLAVYLAVAVLGELRPGADEVFPFASWSLFSRVHNAADDFSLRFTEVTGVPLPEPTWWEQMSATFTEARLHPPRMLLQRWGEAVESGDEAAAARREDEFVALYLQPSRPLSFTLSRRTYDPLVRWQTGRIERWSPLLDRRLVTEDRK